MYKSLLFAVPFITGLNCFVIGQNNTLIPFSLEDQFEITYTDTKYKGHFVIVIAGDRIGSDYSYSWFDVVREAPEKNALHKNTKVVGVANLQGVPKYLRNLIKSKFPQEKKRWVLLDWDGLFNEAYHFE